MACPKRVLWPEIVIAARGEALTVILEGCLRNKLQHFAANYNGLSMSVLYQLILTL